MPVNQRPGNFGSELPPLKSGTPLSSRTPSLPTIFSSPVRYQLPLSQYREQSDFRCRESPHCRQIPRLHRAQRLVDCCLQHPIGLSSDHHLFANQKRRCAPDTHAVTFGCVGLHFPIVVCGSAGYQLLNLRHVDDKAMFDKQDRENAGWGTKDDIIALTKTIAGTMCGTCPVPIPRPPGLRHRQSGSRARGTESP